MSRRAFILLVSLSVPLLIASSGFATDYYVNGATGHDSYDGLAPEWNGVNGPKATIQAGIDAASGGDTVTVADGTYTGDGNRDLDFGGKAIRLRSANGAETCIIDCQGTEADPHRGFYFHLGETGTSVLDGFTIQGGCIADTWGGAILCESSSPTIANCTISANSAYLGGGISCDRSPTISNCTITGNSAEDFGGGICCGRSTTITDCTITDNSADRGGGIYCSGGSPRITNCTITGNSAEDSGGGIDCWFGSPTITNCMITGNSAEDSGGGIDCVFSSPTIINCTIISNSTGSAGGGVLCGSRSSLTIAHCTITGNSAVGGGGLLAYGGSDVTMRDCIVWGNMAGYGHEIAVDDTVTVFRYCDIEGGAAEVYVDGFYGGTVDYDATNIEVDPLVRSDGHLRADSPCIDYCPDGPSSDVDGETRPVDVPGVGVDGERTFDIGADEFVDTDGDGMPDWWELAHFGSPTAARPWRDPDRDWVRNIHEYEHALNPFDPDTDDDGRRDGRELRDGTNPRHPDNAQKTYYVNGATGDDDWDGLAPWHDGIHGPKKTIQAGIDATVTAYGYTVLVANGTYTGDGNRDLDLGGKTITLRSEHGPEACTMDCEENGGGILVRHGEPPNTVIDGLTIINASLHGIDCLCTSPTITNCTITNCTIVESLEGAYGAGIYSRGGSPMIINCTITENSADDEGGGIYCEDGSPTITNCTITGNSARGGGGVYCRDGSPMISGCTITDNSVVGSGGGIDCSRGSPTITNSTITGNSANRGGGLCFLGSPTISNCTITGNSASYGGGIHCNRGSPTITNCTITDNSASQYAGGMYCYREGNATIRNSILWGNLAPLGHELGLEGWFSTVAVVTLRYSDVQGGAAEAHVGEDCTLDMDASNIDADPLFVDAAGGDLRLRYRSPCIDAGTSDGAPDRDINGARRWDVRTIPNTGGGDKPWYDIGAYEFCRRRPWGPWRRPWWPWRKPWWPWHRHFGWRRR